LNDIMMTTTTTTTTTARATTTTRATTTRRNTGVVRRGARAGAVRATATTTTMHSMPSAMAIRRRVSRSSAGFETTEKTRSSAVARAGGGAVEINPNDPPEEEVFDMSEGGQKRRWGMVFALFVAFVLCNLDKVNMSVAIVPMAESFGWTATQKGLVASAFFWGYSFTQIPGGWLASKYGGKAVLFWGVMLWSFGTLIAPWCAALGMPALLASRFLVGLGEGVAPSAATGVLAKGVPPSQRSKAVTTAFGGLDVGSLTGLLIAPPIIFHLGGWPAVFYLFGALGFIWGAWWFVSYMRDNSTDMKEAASAAGAKKGLSIPWGAFVRNPQFWALTVAHFTWNYFSYGLLAWLPSFLAGAMGVTLSKSSFLSILPYLSTVVMTAIIAPLAGELEAKKKLTRTQIRKGSQTLCFGVGAITLTAIGFIVNATPVEAVTNQTIALVVGLLSVTFGFAAFIRTGLFCGHQDLSPKYASIMLGVTNTAAAIASTLSTFFTGLFLSQTGGNWAYSLFFPIAALQAVSVFVFMIWKSDPVDFDAAN
jgi:ACS family sodium-dependent inorganic phosphate cotransporter